jgi:signal transduction histidine kinase
MTALMADVLFTGSTADAYRGADRRGMVARLATPATSRLAVWMVVAVIALPLVGVGVLSLASRLPVGAVSTGASDTALVAFLATALVLLLRWRLVGEAASAPLAALAFLAGVFVVSTAHVAGPVAGYAIALQTTSVVVMVGVCIGALVLPEISAGLRPTMIVGWAMGGALALAIPLAFAPVALGLLRGSGGIDVVSAVEAVASALVAVALLGRGMRGRNLLFAGAGAALLSIAADCAVLAAGPLALTGPWTALPSFLLLLGATVLLMVAGTDLRSVLSAVVLHDMRGRRRWVAAESELSQVRSAYRGQRHDVASMLSAVDGTLLVLAQQSDSLPPERSTQLIGAVRGQIQRLMTLLAEDRGSARTYDLSELLAGIVAVHASRFQTLLSTAEPALEVHGHPDRVMRIVNNLLVNAALYAPAASVSLTARRAPRPSDGEMAAELIIADDGPGLTDAELAHAFEPGWRGGHAARVAGSGLGLSQCCELAEAEGGEIALQPTHPSGAPGGRGLTVRIRIPLHPAAPAAPRSSILQIPAGQGAAIPDVVVLDQGHRRGQRAGAVTLI